MSPSLPRHRNRWSTLATLLLIAGCCGKQPPPIPPAPPPPAAVTVEIPWSESGIDWSRRPPPGPEPELRLPAPASFELGNGMKVLVVENRQLPLVSMRLVNPYGGATRDPQGSRGLAALTADLLDEGTASRSALAIADELERLGATLDLAADIDAAMVSVDTLSATFEATLELVAELVAAPAFAAADFDRVKADRLSVIKRRRDRPHTVAGLIFDRVVFGSHAYGLPNSGLEATLAAISHSQVVQFYADHYSPAEMTLVLAGDVDTAAITPILERTLGRWPPKKLRPNRPTLELPRSQPPRLIVCDRPASAQSVVWIGRVAMTRKHPRYFDALVINTVLGGGFTSRLNNRLREQLGYTYGASSAFWFGRESGSWSFHSSLKTANTIAGVREALALIEGVRAAEVPADELDRAKQLIIRQLPQELETNASVAASFADLVIDDLDLDWYGNFATGVGQVAGAAARQLAVDYFRHDDLIMVVVGDLQVILPGLLELGFGPALEVGPEGDPLRTHQQ